MWFRYIEMVQYWTGRWPTAWAKKAELNLWYWYMFTVQKINYKKLLRCHQTVFSLNLYILKHKHNIADTTHHSNRCQYKINHV